MEPKGKKLMAGKQANFNKINQFTKPVQPGRELRYVFDIIKKNSNLISRAKEIT